MTVRGAIFSGHNAGELTRWLMSGALVLGIHGGIAAALSSWVEPGTPGAAESAITLELAPLAAAPAREQSDSAELSPELTRNQPESAQEQPEKAENKEHDPPPELAEKPPEPQIEPPPVQPKAEIVLPPLPPKRAPKEPPKRKLAAIQPQSIEVDRVELKPVAPAMGQLADVKTAFGRLVTGHLQRHKRFPSAAQARSEEGTVLLNFTLNRQGQVIASGIAKSSGHAELDREALDMLRRAQPFPTPPADLAGQQFPYTAPMRYYLR